MSYRDHLQKWRPPRWSDRAIWCCTGMILTILTARPKAPWIPHICWFRCCFEKEKGAAISACPASSQYLLCCWTEKQGLSLTKITSRHWSETTAVLLAKLLYAEIIHVTQNYSTNVSLGDVFPIQCTCCGAKCFQNLEPGPLLAGRDFIASWAAVMWLPNENGISYKGTR